MSHHKYTTEAFVINLRSRREADALVTLFTRELGVIQAVATGLRRLLSKMRMSVGQYSHIRVSVVQGKDFWRLTNAEPRDEYWGSFSKEAKLSFARLSTFLARMMPAGEKHEEIFNHLIDCSNFLILLSKSNPKEIQRKSELIELIFVLRALHGLGYLGNPTEWKYVLEGDITEEVLEHVEKDKKKALNKINSTLESSHL